jgi:hypothetical protein
MASITNDWMETIKPVVNPAKQKKKRSNKKNGVHTTINGKGKIARIPKK